MIHFATDGNPTHPHVSNVRMPFVRWMVRGVFVSLALVSCAAASAPPPSPRPNEVQVVEPAGQPDRYAFAPRELAVAKGTTVTFVNHGKEFHTVTSDAPGRPFDKALDAGQTASLTFDTVGVFTYHCGVHPVMKGTVRVCDGACG